MVIFLAIVFSSFTCTDLGEVVAPATTVQVIPVALRNTETYQFLTNVGGDEEGVLITKQAAHYSVSEIRRDASTSFLCVYIYEPQAGYTGSDYAELEIRINKAGTSESTQVSRLGFSFTVTN
jgi:hypothetical protein